MAWKSFPGSAIQAPISSSGDYWYSHRRDGYYLNFSPPGAQHSLGTHPTERAARAAAKTHKAALASGKIRPDGKPIDAPETESEHAMRLVRQHRERISASETTRPTRRRRNRTGLSPTEISGAIHRAKVLTAAKKIPPTVRRAGPNEPAPSAWASMAGTTWMRIEVYERIGSRIQRVDQFNVMAATPQIAQRYAIAQHLLDARRPLSDARRFDTIVKRG